ncbi:MAG: hypothetical protein ABR991_07850 [Terracidiphilus sp.]|jgi:hypothetical protein
MGTPTPQLKIPSELLSAFQTDVRFIPNHLPVAGYITFDRAMLISILRSQDDAAKERFITALEKLDPQWELILAAPAEQQAVAAD